MNIIETSEDGRYRLRLELDQDPQSPRQESDANLCHVITQSHSYYTDVDEDGGPLRYGWNRLKDRDETGEVFARWARIFHGAVVDVHTPVQGPVSFWYLLPADVADAGIPDPAACIRDEITEYQAWADGEVYGYVIEKAVSWDRRDGDESMTTWEEADSCWGFIDHAYAEESAREEFKAHVKGAQDS